MANNDSEPTDDRLEEACAKDLSPPRSMRGRPATIIKLVHEVSGVRFRYAGNCGGNGGGDLISAAKADAIRRAFTAPYAVERIQCAGLYDDGGFCRACQKFYWYEHWHVSTTGGGECPERHFKRLDSHWSPDE